LRNAAQKWKTPTFQNNDTQKFSFDDITAFLFDEKPFEVTAFPFKRWKSSSLKNIQVTFQLRHFIAPNIFLKDVVFTISKVQNAKVTPSQLFELPPSVLSALYTEYIYQTMIWETYFYKNIKEYCQTPVSAVKWEEFKYSRFISKSNYAKAIWVSICSSQDREFWVKFAISIRDSLLPWLNSEMYIKYKDKLENTRTNVAYEGQRKAMVEGRIQDLEKHLEEDLDIVE